MTKLSKLECLNAEVDIILVANNNFCVKPTLFLKNQWVLASSYKFKDEYRLIYASKLFSKKSLFYS
jgi:hypothetical protein